MTRRYPVHFAMDLTRIIALLLTSGSMTMAATQQADQTVEQPRVSVTSLAMLPDGVPLVGRSDGEIVAIDLRTGATTGFFARHSASVTEIAVDPRGEFVAAASTDGRVAVWPVVVTDEYLKRDGYPGLTDPTCVLHPTPGVWKDPLQVEWTHDGGHLVTWSFDPSHGDSPTTVQLWSRAGKLLWTGPHARQVTIHPTHNCIAAVVEDEVLLGWPGGDLQTIALKGAYDSVEFSPDGSQLAVGGRDFNVWVLDGKSGATRRHKRATDVDPLQLHHYMARLRWSPDGRHLGVITAPVPIPAILVADGLETTWTGDIYMYSGGMGPFYDIAWTPGGRLLAGRHLIIAVDPETGDREDLIQDGEVGGLIELANSSDVLLLAGGTVRRIDLETAKVAWKRPR